MFTRECLEDTSKDFQRIHLNIYFIPLEIQDLEYLGIYKETSPRIIPDTSLRTLLNNLLNFPLGISVDIPKNVQ